MLGLLPLVHLTDTRQEVRVVNSDCESLVSQGLLAFSCASSMDELLVVVIKRTVEINFLAVLSSCVDDFLVLHKLSFVLPEEDYKEGEPHKSAYELTGGARLRIFALGRFEFCERILPHLGCCRTTYRFCFV